jgi:hypothetical protein
VPPTLDEVMELSWAARQVLGEYGLVFTCFIEFAVGR